VVQEMRGDKMVTDGNSTNQVIESRMADGKKVGKEGDVELKFKY
jgi:hypothetical protein